MKQMMKRIAVILCLLAALCLTGAACAEDAEAQDLPVFSLPVGAGQVEVQTELIDEELWLFLPAFAQLEELSVEGAELEWWDSEPDEEGLWYVDVICEEEVQEVSVMRSANLRTMFLFSDDPVHQGRAFVEDDSTKHENEAPASLILTGADGEIDHAEHIEKLRGRGNGSWERPKRSYQIKLDDSIDLMDTGDRANRAKKWLLMAEPVDGTMLHNQISMDLGRELGLTVMESEFIDLYYDGSYRGIYRLSEKIEVSEGRVDVLDYDHLIKKWNKKVGQADLEQLPDAQNVNRFGNAYTYVEGVVDDSRPDAGAFLVEMEWQEDTLSDRCYFSLRDSGGSLYALKNPENATQKMMQFISERLQEAQDTLQNGGVNPETGATAAEEFDLDAFARTLLVQELSGNIDGYVYSSSFFILPEGERRFIPGPLWDLDLAYRWMTDGSDCGPVGLKDSSGWITDFYRVPDFVEIAQRIFQQELYPLIQNVLLGQEHGVYLKPISDYVGYISASKRMNDARWDSMRDWRLHYADTFESEIQILHEYLDQRSRWLNEAYQVMNTADANHLALWLTLRYANPDDSLRFVSFPWEGIDVQVTSVQQLTEADEDTYAQWSVEAVLSAADGSSLEGRTVSLNGTMLDTHLQEDGSLLIRAQYEDESYLPVDYYGEDVGLIYQYDRYIRYYPQVAEECGYDEQEVMDYFFDEGIYEGQVGNGFFDPRYVMWLVPHVEDYLLDDWSMYYWEYLSWGEEAEWLNESVFSFSPRIENLP